MPYMLVCLDVSIMFEFKQRFGIDLRKNVSKVQFDVHNDEVFWRFCCEKTNL